MPELFNPARSGGSQMKIRSLILTVLTGALLTLFCLNGFAEGGKLPFTHASSGAIVLIDANRLVVTHRKNGKPETLDFVLTPATSRKGDLAIGNVVSVHYRMEKDQRLATSIQAQRSRTPARKPK